jgi:hypothetical protein
MIRYQDPSQYCHFLTFERAEVVEKAPAYGPVVFEDVDDGWLG